MAKKARLRSCILLLVFIIPFTLSGSATLADSIPDEQFDGLGNGYQYGTPGHGYLSMWFTDSDVSPMPPSITAFTPGIGAIFPKKCSSLSDPICLKEQFIEVNTQFPVCAQYKVKNCIQDIWAVDKTGLRIEGVFVREIKGMANPSFTESVEFAIPQASLPQIVRFPTLMGYENQDFLLTASLKGAQQVNINTLTQNDRQIEIFFHAVIVEPASVKLETGATNWIKFAVDNKKYNSCVAIGEGECAKPVALPSGIRFGTKIRSSKNISTWLESRSKNPLVIVEKNSDGYTTSLEGEPVIIPSISGGGDFISLPVELRNRYPEADPGKLNSHITWGKASARQGTTTLNDLKLWLPYLGEKATVMPTAWSFRTLGVLASSQLKSEPYSSCSNQSSTDLLGMVSSNATAFSSGPPTFNSESASLDYQIAAPHLSSKSEVFKGSYSLVMNSKFARCIYKLTNAPVKATVSVVNSNGQNQVATESVSENGEWIRLSVEGFTFSSPTVRVKLTQEITQDLGKQPETVVKNTSKAPSQSVRKTISCQKGKVVKRVNAINPKCPSGYKKVLN